MIRVSEVEDLSWERGEEFMNCFDKAIVSKEVSKDGKDHFHMIVQAKNILMAVTPIKIVWPDAHGNKCLYCKPAKDEKQAFKYVLKDGEFKYKGIEKELIDRYYMLSSPKVDITKEIADLEDKLILNEVTIHEFVMKHIELKVAAKQNLYNNHLAAYFRRIAVQVGAIDLYEYANMFIDDLMLNGGRRA